MHPHPQPGSGLPWCSTLAGNGLCWAHTCCGEHKQGQCQTQRQRQHQAAWPGIYNNLWNVQRPSSLPSLQNSASSWSCVAADSAHGGGRSGVHQPISMGICRASDRIRRMKLSTSWTLMDIWQKKEQSAKKSPNQDKKKEKKKIPFNQNPTNSCNIM